MGCMLDLAGSASIQAFFLSFDILFGCVSAVSTLLLPLNTLPMNLFPV